MSEGLYDDWDELEKTCMGCRKCGLSQGRENVVFGVGDRKSPLMFVGEGPGEQEDRTGLPFVGRGGQLLDRMLAVIGLKRENVYIANTVKCRPPQNRDPFPEELECCRIYLDSQIALIKPRLVVCLGRIAAGRLISPDFKVTERHGEWIMKDGYLIMGTFHPAALLRNPNLKTQALEDLRAIESKLAEIKR